MSVIYKITGYDKRTERLEVEHDIPRDRLQPVMDLAHVSEQQAADFGSVPLEPSTVRQIGRQINRNVSSDLYDWFLEPFAGQ